jgi:glucosamine--fructose-6-phosphate aminotransferase (isomerizing)
VGEAARAEHFLARDAMALAGVTDQIVYLEDGDVVDCSWAATGSSRVTPTASPAGRAPAPHAHSGAAELGPYRHYMQKEIFEQPRAMADTLEGVEGITPELFGDGAYRFGSGALVRHPACGTSYGTLA